MMSMWLLIFIFLVIFAPLIILPFNIIHILALASIFILLTKHKKDFHRIIQTREIKIFVSINILIAIYSICLSILTRGDFGFAYYAVSTVFEILPCAIYISIIFLKNNINIQKCYQIILVVGLMQSGVVILELFIPGLRDWIVSNSGSDSLEYIYDLTGGYRIYGLARGYTFSMPLFMGLCVIVALVLSKYSSPKYYMTIPFFILVIVLNSRTALLSLLVAPFIIFLFRLRGSPGREIFWIIFLMSLAILFNEIIYNASQDAAAIGTWYWWLNLGLDELRVLSTNKIATGNMEALTDTMWFTPSGVELFFGTGENIFMRNNNPSDIGYVINLYYGGLFYSLLLYSAYIIFIFQGFAGKKFERVIGVSLIIFMLLVNFKGSVFRVNEITTGVLILAVYSIASRKLKLTS